jgi:hypothetical protein
MWIILTIFKFLSFHVLWIIKIYQSKGNCSTLKEVKGRDSRLQASLLSGFSFWQITKQNLWLENYFEKWEELANAVILHLMIIELL